ncbi:MAG TPA: lipoyl(octanoyl) transferase LipB [Thermoanaerobaculia bacterium]|nr:lipoyl(octanoyl) transferase LipB [Thermoanaerobaculia bacterium]
MPMRKCELHRLHVVTYENGMTLQQKLVEMRQREEIDDQLLLLEHPPVITLGRGGKLDNLLATPELLEASGVRFFETTRGGDITYHGPGQIVGYPILHLGEGKRDVRRYVSNLEEVLIRTVAAYGITAERVDGKRGIWVGNDKIAAIGVRIARWVTSHGWALNVSTNLEHFRLITPCGLQGTGVTSIERETGRRIDVREVREVLADKFAEVFERELVDRPETLRLVKVLVHDRDRILLLHRRPERGNFWQPITGTIDEGEAPIETARRELVEETGHATEPASLDLAQSFMIESQYLESKGYVSPIIASEIGFRATLDSALPIRIDPAEHDDWGWFTFAEAYERIRWTDDREALTRLAARLPAGGSPLSAPSGPDNASRITDNLQPTTTSS